MYFLWLTELNRFYCISFPPPFESPYVHSFGHGVQRHEATPQVRAAGLGFIASSLALPVLRADNRRSTNTAHSTELSHCGCEH